MNTIAAMNPVGKYIALFFLSCAVAILGVSGWKALVSSNQKAIASKMVQSQIDQYQIVERNGNNTEKAMYAGSVAQAFLMIKDEENYRKWKGISESWQEAAQREHALQFQKATGINLNQPRSGSR